MDRQIQTNHAAMLPSRHYTTTSGTKQKSGYKAGDLVDTRDYRYRTPVGSCRSEVGDQKMVATLEPAETKTFRGIWSPNRYPIIHIARYFRYCRRFTCQMVPGRRVKGYPSVIPDTWHTFVSTGGPQGQFVRISSLTKGDVKENFIVF